MRRLLILISVIPVIVSLIAAHLMGWRVLNKRIKLALNLGEILEKLSSYGVSYKSKKKVWSALPLAKDGSAHITEKELESDDSQVVSAELLRVGMAEINKTHPEMIQWRCKVLKFGYFLPPFILLGGTLAVAVKRLPAGWFLAVFAIVLAACTVMLWLSRTVEKEAAIAITNLIERKRILPRLSEEEALVESIKAWTWISVLPGILVSLMAKINRGKEEV